MFTKKKKQQPNELTNMLSNDEMGVEEKIKRAFGEPHFVNFLQNSLRSELDILINFLVDNIEPIINYVLTDAPVGEDKITIKLKDDEIGKHAMISRNISLSLSSSSNKLRTRLSIPKDEADIEKAKLFKKRMIEFVGSDDVTESTSNHWGKIMSSFAANSKFMFFKEEVDKILPEMISHSEYPGYRDLIQSLASQNVEDNSKIFLYISQGIADNMREYRIYSKDKRSNKDYIDLLYNRTFYLLKIINQCYTESSDLDLGSWDNKFEIVKNLLEGILAEQEKKLVLDAGVNVLCIVMDIINKYSNDDDDEDKKTPESEEEDRDDKTETSKSKKASKSDEESAHEDKKTYDQMAEDEAGSKLHPSQIIRKMVRATGKSFYAKLGLYDMEITPDMEDYSKLDLIIRTFPIFWEAGINQLSPLLFYTYKFPEKTKRAIEISQDALAPTKIAKTITDKVCKWISILNPVNESDFLSSTKDSSIADKDKNKKEKMRANRKLIKFIESNKIIEKLKENFPEDILKDGKPPFLNPFIIILAELLSVGFLKPKIEYNGNVGESSISYTLTGLGDLQDPEIVDFPQSIQNDEFTQFLFEKVIPVSTELNKIEVD